MERKYPHLCSPIRIGNTIFRNRMFSAPMGGTDITPECTIGRGSTAFYELRASGGAAAVTVSECMVHPETDRSFAYHLDLHTPGALGSFAYTADAISRHGSVPSVELSHSGQFAGTYLTDSSKKESITQYGVVESTRADGLVVRELTEEKIQEIVKAYGDCAGLAKRVGFGMITVHGGHGWLINQFLSPLFNSRKDKYGGSLENRTRFAREVLKSIRNAVGRGFPIELRISGSELTPGGYDLDEGIEIAKILQEDIDLLHVSAGTYQKGFSITHPSMFREHGCNVYLASEIKKHVNIPVGTLGGLNSPEMMEEIIASGKADVVYMARALLADHMLPRKVVENREQEIAHCLRCFTCMAERAQTATRRCTINPLIGRELEGFEVPAAAKSKKVLVIGGGPGGLQAAITAAERGHKVTLCEKENVLGGILYGERAIDFKREMYMLGVTLEHRARLAGVEIIMGKEVTPAWVEEQKPDAVIVAIGSEPILPPVTGIDSDSVIMVTDYHNKTEKIGESVIVLGGGLAGCEIALYLAKEGKSVELIEMRDELAPDANLRHRPILLEELNSEDKLKIHTGHRAVEITDAGLKCVDKDNKEVLIPGDTIICAAGQRALSDAALGFKDCAPWVSVVGDCRGVGNITKAIYEGHHAAMDV